MTLLSNGLKMEKKLFLMARGELLSTKKEKEYISTFQNSNYFRGKEEEARHQELQVRGRWHDNGQDHRRREIGSSRRQT